ncbi:IS200/IS605 family transposase [Ancylomarina longa]|uniref:IS200/IS605 family transposase n=1 Tax=Ancylomarina longa TaxID=2487017 RepID=A0A434AYP6_9BACT|nr:IS200/IS605 family transposase [Ancylomarina longa]RUT79701.1 IS200/IS605 family transposase [Ancylomarina longa]
MSSYRQIYYHIIFRTKKSGKILPLSHIEKLFAYIFGIIKQKGCHLYRINGMQDHIHILSDLHPSISLADFMREIKTSSSVWLKQQTEFSDFKGWADGYAALTVSYGDKDDVLNYIKNQQNHHQTESFSKEFRRLLESEGIDIDERYFLK